MVKALNPRQSFQARTIGLSGFPPDVIAALLDELEKYWEERLGMEQDNEERIRQLEIDHEMRQELIMNGKAL